MFTCISIYIYMYIFTYIYIHNHLHIATTRGNQLHEFLATEQFKVQVFKVGLRGWECSQNESKKSANLTPILEVRTSMAEASWEKHRSCDAICSNSFRKLSDCVLACVTTSFCRYFASTKTSESKATQFKV